jgi:hypothetical protein
MNKNLFIVILIILALGVTLGAVYYLNILNINQSSVNNTSERKDENSSLGTEEYLIPQVTSNANIIMDENTPKNYNNTELMNLEREINSLDLSNEGDIE